MVVANRLEASISMELEVRALTAGEEGGAKHIFVVEVEDELLDPLALRTSPRSQRAEWKWFRGRTLAVKLHTGVVHRPRANRSGAAAELSLKSRSKFVTDC